MAYHGCPPLAAASRASHPAPVRLAACAKCHEDGECDRIVKEESKSGFARQVLIVWCEGASKRTTTDPAPIIAASQEVDSRTPHSEGAKWDHVDERYICVACVEQ